jgi:O-antigen/teichoic acid export membrane protein
MININKQSNLKNIINLFLSNLFKFLSSLIIIFTLPNFLGVENYGYYKIFLLYLSYLGIFHFGFIDGIYLKYVGENLESLDQIKFRTYFYFFVGFQILITIFLIIFVVFFLSNYRLLILIFVIVNLVPINVITYFQFISQITSRFNEYSRRLFFLSILNLVSVLLLIIFNLTNYFYILLFSTISNLILFSIYIITYKSFIFGLRIKLQSFVDEIFELFKLGFPLLLSNFILILLLSIDRLFVEYIFDIYSFSIYAFSFSILVLINLFVSSISTVLFPFFKKIDKTILSNSYSSLNLILNFIVFLGLFIYFPIYILIPTFLPDYIDSLSIIRIALPGLVFTSSITALAHNIYKVFNNNKEFLLIGIISLISLILFLYISYLYLPNIENVAYATLFGMIFWYVLLHEFNKKKYKIFYFKNFIYSLFFVTVFLVLSSNENIVISGFLYLVFYGGFFLLEFTNLKKALLIIRH